jgi:hypothetical protein
MLEILQQFRHIECQNPRDKVYAPLCLGPLNAVRLIVLDYKQKSVLDVYMGYREVLSFWSWQ